MSIRGVDYSWDRPSISTMKRDGVKFACRYLSHNTTGKNLTRSEADKLLAAGISPVSNWENAASEMLNGKAAGTRTAREALKQHIACGGPEDAPIFWSVDFDASASQLSRCLEYLKGVNEVLPWSRIGVYGSFKTIEWMFGRGPSWYWQTYAWSSGKWSSHAHIQQYKNNVQYAGALVDHDRAMTNNFGQWVHPNGIMAHREWGC